MPLVPKPPLQPNVSNWYAFKQLRMRAFRTSALGGEESKEDQRIPLDFRDEPQILSKGACYMCESSRQRHPTLTFLSFFLKTFSGNISQECPANKIKCQRDKITMIQSANVMNRGAGSDTQGYALPKFITDVSLWDRAPFKRVATPGLCFLSQTGNECWREEDTITRCQSTELSSVLALPS